MYGPIKIAPSILSADFMNFGKDLAMLEAAGADLIHVDVMDGHFVPNLTIGVPFVKQAKKATSLPLDVHLMISNPLTQLPWYIDAGSDSITIHWEACANDDEVWEALSLIKDANIKSAISIKPDTDVEVLRPFIASIDMVLVMSVYPGFSGQSYIEGSEDKVRALAEMARELNPSLLIQVDGGISVSRTAALVAENGADVLVAGSGVFATDNPAEAITALREVATQAQ